MERAEAITRGEPVSSASGDPLLELVDSIARHAYRVTDEQIAALRDAGRSEDELFDVIIATAVGAGVARRTVGLDAIAAWEARR
jgi:alkylhydroperoxidase family enzyme